MFKKVFMIVFSLVVLFVFCGCEKNEDVKTNNAEVLENEKMLSEDFEIELIEKAKEVFEIAKIEECDFNNASVIEENDDINNRKLYTVNVTNGEKNAYASFDEDSTLAKFSSGYVSSDGGNVIYTEDKVDELLELAKGYYNSLEVPEGYVLSGWQMDFGGPDWQVEFTRKIDVNGYKEDVYNYSEQVRMRISGESGKLLSVNVFNTPLNTDKASEEYISYKEALEISKLPEDKLEKSYIGCYTVKDKGYARLCWCFEADLSEGEACNTKWVYVDLYTGKIVGEESCG